MKKPAISFYPDNFLGGVAFMSMEERGIYITLLAYQALRGNIPQERLGFLVGLTWDNLPELVKEKFTLNNKGEIYNERMFYEIEKRAAFIEKQTKNGKLGGRPRKDEKPKKNPETNPNETLNDIEIENENKGDSIYPIIEKGLIEKFKQAYGETPENHEKFIRSLNYAINLDRADINLLILRARDYNEFCIIKNRSKKDIWNWLDEKMYETDYSTALKYHHEKNGTTPKTTTIDLSKYKK